MNPIDRSNLHDPAQANFVYIPFKNHSEYAVRIIEYGTYDIVKKIKIDGKDYYELSLDFFELEVTKACLPEITKTYKTKQILDKALNSLFDFYSSVFLRETNEYLVGLGLFIQEEINNVKPERLLKSLNPLNSEKIQSIKPSSKNSSNEAPAEYAQENSFTTADEDKFSQITTLLKKHAIDNKTIGIILAKLNRLTLSEIDESIYESSSENEQATSSTTEYAEENSFTSADEDKFSQITTLLKKHAVDNKTIGIILAKLDRLTLSEIDESLYESSFEDEQAASSIEVLPQNENSWPLETEMIGNEEQAPWKDFCDLTPEIQAFLRQQGFSSGTANWTAILTDHLPQQSQLKRESRDSNLRLENEATTPWQDFSYLTPEIQDLLRQQGFTSSMANWAAILADHFPQQDQPKIESRDSDSTLFVPKLNDANNLAEENSKISSPKKESGSQSVLTQQSFFSRKNISSTITYAAIFDTAYLISLGFAGLLNSQHIALIVIGLAACTALATATNYIMSNMNQSI